MRNAEHDGIGSSCTEWMRSGCGMTDDEAKQIRRDLDRCRKALETDNVDVIQAALEQLEHSSYRIAEVMYKDVG